MLFCLSLKKADIIPSILPDFTPICEISVTYSTKSKSSQGDIKSEFKVSLGNKLKPSYTKDKPTEVAIKCYDKDGRISDISKMAEGQVTIALTDPDAPSREDPKWSEMCHWIATESADLLDCMFDNFLQKHKLKRKIHL